MSTFLFDKIIFGPVKSRRLGVSLGINLLPLTGKICNFDCIYCECGLNGANKGLSNKLPSRIEVKTSLEAKLSEMIQNNQIPDVITFAGNGEPTLHPEFSGIIDDTLALRDKYVRTAKVSVLSNSTMLHKQDVVNALLKIDQNILKLDSGLSETVQCLNQPAGNFKLPDIIEHLKQFNGKLIIQTMFVKGVVNGTLIDNTSDKDLKAWINSLTEINPQMIMIYTIERDTPHEGLKKVPKDILLKIAERLEQLGFKVQVSG